MAEHFTVVFEGDIMDFDFNPLKAVTPFGIPYAAGIGDALAEADAFRAALESIASNTCCDGCQEAAKWARDALDPRPVGASSLGHSAAGGNS